MESKIAVTAEGMVTEVRPLFAKALAPIEVTFGGIETEASLLHPLKVEVDIIVTVDGIFTKTRDLQPEKALSPKEVTEEGIVTDAKEVQLKKA